MYLHRHVCTYLVTSRLSKKIDRGRDRVCAVLCVCVYVSEREREWERVREGCIMTCNITCRSAEQFVNKFKLFCFRGAFENSVTYFHFGVQTSTFIMNNSSSI